MRDLKIIVMKKTNDQAKCLIRDCFFVRQGERRERCFYSEILYVEASGCYSRIYFRDRSTLFVTNPLVATELLLPRNMFRRVHRSYIVNLWEIEGFVNNTICIDDILIPMSSRYREEVFGCFVFWNFRSEKKGEEDKSA